MLLPAEVLARPSTQLLTSDLSLATADSAESAMAERANGTTNADF